jgi:hypothetical protein
MSDTAGDRLQVEMLMTFLQFQRLLAVNLNAISTGLTKTLMFIMKLSLFIPSQITTRAKSSTSLYYK